MCDPNHTRKPCVQIYFLPHFLTCRVRIVDILFVDIFLLLALIHRMRCILHKFGNSSFDSFFCITYSRALVSLHYLFECSLSLSSCSNFPPSNYNNKNNLHLLLFFIVCFCVSYSRLRTEFLFIHLLGDVFCIVVRSFCFIHIYGFVCTFAVGIVQKCHCFHASECVEMCSWCGVERSLANCANIIKSIL